MGTVPDLLRTRWRSRNHVGSAKPQLIVRVRQGLIDRGYRPASYVGKPLPTIFKGHNTNPWGGWWRSTGAWITVPNVQHAGFNRSFADKGTSALTVLVDSIAFVENTGVAGVYHDIKRGWMSPTRGAVVTSRPKLWETNAWRDVFNGGYQIELWEGYAPDGEAVPGGTGMSRTWVGLLEDCDLESHPDHITITARDYGVLLTDQRMMGWNKAREIKSPVTFADRRKTLGEEKVNGSAVASSEEPGRPASGVTKKGGAIWVSQAHATENVTEWIEIHVPAGHYEEFYVAPHYNGMEMFLSIYCHGGACKVNGAAVADGWVDLGLGAVPGTLGGEPYVKHWGKVSAHHPMKRSLGLALDCGDDTTIRVSFRELVYDKGYGSFRAGCDRLCAYRYGTDPRHPPDGSPGVSAKHWVLVDDAADVIRTVLFWAGFQEWEVEDFGLSLDAPMHWGQDKFFIDVIDEILAFGNYVFYLKAPTDSDTSIGVPVFRKQRATTPPPSNMLAVRDTDMIEALRVKFDMSNLPFVIRFRGDADKSGVTLGEDTLKRFQATYFPPWSGADYTKLGAVSAGGAFDIGRTGGVRRHFTSTAQDKVSASLGSNDECMFACILAAIQYALQLCTGSFQIPGLPGVELDEQCSVVDEGTGTNTRMWIASVQSDHHAGPNGSYHMTVGGAMLDTEDFISIAYDYLYQYLVYLRHKAEG